jgi:hypothetical protein
MRDRGIPQTNKMINCETGTNVQPYSLKLLLLLLLMVVVVVVMMTVVVVVNIMMIIIIFSSSMKREVQICQLEDKEQRFYTFFSFQDAR